MKNHRLLGALVVILISTSSLLAQNIKIQGLVKDSIGAPLEMANIVALSASDSSMVTYAITNAAGKYELRLPADSTYILRYSYLGFTTLDEKLSLEGVKNPITKNISLKPSNNQLNEVEVVEEIPIAVSGDTITFKADAFTDGNEKKLEDVLEQLPGFEIDDNGEVKVQGKQVEKVMVEGKDFFDGDTKVATKNIPANAIDKVQVLRNYNEVSPMQGLGTDDRIALNIKLKEGKKNITFGDISAEAGLDERYLVHPNVFYYTPKASFNVIGDINNIGKPAFTFRDYFRFTGGFKNLSQRSGSSLQIAQDDIGFSMIADNRASELNSKFGAANFSFNPNKKWSFSGFAIGNTSFTASPSTTYRTYVRDSLNNQETLTTNNNQTSSAGLFKLSSTYTPDNALHIGYDALLKVTDLEEDRTQLSDFGIFTNNINSVNSQKPISFNQNFEMFYDMDAKSVIALEVQHLYKKQDPLFELNTSQRAFGGAFPIVDTSVYNLLQNKVVTSNKVDASLNYYYILNNKNHLNFTAGVSNSNQSLTSAIAQLYNGTTIAQFDGDSLNNDVFFKLTDVFAGVHYKTIIGKLTMNPGVNLHYYNVSDEQLGSTELTEKVLLLPDFYAKYDFKSSESLTLTYNMLAQFTDINNVIQGTTISSYNSLFQGNRNLNNSLYHSVALNYYSFNMFNFTNIFAGANYTRRIGDITNTVLFKGFDRVNQPINTDAINDNITGFGSYSRRFWKLKASVRANVSISNTNNQVDNENNTNTSFTQSYTARLGTNFKKAPNVDFGFTRTTNNYQSSFAKNTYITNRPFIEFDARFLKYFSFEADYQFNDYKSKEGGTRSTYDFLNAALYFQKDKSKWEFKLQALNLLNTQTIRQDNFSDNLISTSEYVVLPRYVMFGVKYNL